MPSALAKARVLVAVAYAVALAAAVGTAAGLDGKHPLVVAAAADIVATLVIFGFSFHVNNSSIYDPFWSVAPIPIAVYWCLSGLDVPSGRIRAAIAIVLVVVWSIRLTFNWVRRWKGREDEDWRYVMLRARHGSRYWLVSFFGIHLMPTTLVFAGCLPLFVVLVQPSSDFRALDVAALLVTTIAIWLEAHADRDLATFLKSRKDATELLSGGLWARCRHPNYLGEVLFWWGLFLFGLAADPQYWWTGIGALAITLLFLFVSIPMMEQHMLDRKPDYERYRGKVPAVFPDLSRERKNQPK